MSLSTLPARSLTSREISKLISALLGGLSTWCHPDDIAAAMGHFNEHADEYLAAWRASYERTRPD